MAVIFEWYFVNLIIFRCYETNFPNIFYLTYILKIIYIPLEQCTRINFVLVLPLITIAYMHWKFFIRGIPSREILAPPLQRGAKSIGRGLHCRVLIMWAVGVRKEVRSIP